MQSRLEHSVTAQRLVERSLRAFAPNVAVLDGDRTLTYADLQRRSARLANLLLARGANAERPAASWMPNRAEFIELDVACTRAGILRVGIGDRLSPAESRYIIQHSQTAVLVVDGVFLERLEADALEDVSAVLVVGDHPRDLPADCRFARYEDALRDASPQLTVRAVSGATPNYLLYTSGTTGRPKGATHTHASRAASTVNMLASELRRLDRDTVFVHAAPITHGSGSKIITVMVTGGASLVLPRFDPELLVDAVRRQRGTHTFLVPTMLRRLLDAGPDAVGTVRGMRQISFGGAPIAPALFRSAIEGFGPILTQIYGSSELPHPISTLHADDYASLDPAVLASAGRPAHGVDVAVVSDDGVEVAVKVSGELLIRSAHAMSGYWRNEAATKEVFTRDGWYRSGDVVEMSDDGLLTFRDRKRDLIISGGLNVYPSEVERVLAEHPRVREVAVVGAPDSEWGEIVTAYVVATSDNLSENELIEWVQARLARYKKPRVITFVDSLPTSANGKILKRELRDALWAGEARRVG